MLSIKPQKKLIQQYIVVIVFAILLLLVVSVTASANSTKVWVNTKSHVYHCEGARYYGNTKRGKFMNELSALDNGNRPSRGVYCSTEARNSVNKFKKSDQANTKVWVNTKSRVYHCPNARWYGKTKSGRFMTEGDALSSGNRPAHGHKCN